VPNPISINLVLIYIIMNINFLISQTYHIHRYNTVYGSKYVL
jgi:hypothetical protein